MSQTSQSLWKDRAGLSRREPILKTNVLAISKVAAKLGCHKNPTRGNRGHSGADWWSLNGGGAGLAGGHLDGEDCAAAGVVGGSDGGVVSVGESGDDG
jgi:hypothetical protein